MSSVDVPNLTKHDFERYLELDAERKELMRRARALEAQQEKIEGQIFDFVAARGGKERTVTRSGFVLAIKTKAGTVSWKNEFVRVVGEREAEKLIAAAPTKDYVTVERVA